MNYLKNSINPRISAGLTQLNFLLGTGPLIVPMPFFQAGILFSSFWTLIVWAVNFTTASYIGEAIVLVGDKINEDG